MIACLMLALGMLQPPTVSGIVTDSTGAPLPGANVTLIARADRESTHTLADGSFALPLPENASTVTVRADAAGFAPIDRAVKLPSPSLRFELRPEGVTERVTVSGEANEPHLSIDTSATTIDAKTIASAPALRL